MVARYVEQGRRGRRDKAGRQKGDERKVNGDERREKAVVDKQERGVEDSQQTCVSYNPTVDVTTNPPAAAQVEDVSLHLEPYRGVLPPSLMPASSRTAYPHTLLPEDTSEWG